MSLWSDRVGRFEWRALWLLQRRSNQRKDNGRYEWRYAHGHSSFFTEIRCYCPVTSISSITVPQRSLCRGGKRISLVPRERQNRSIRPTLLSCGNVTFVSASFPESSQRTSFVSVVQKYRRFLSGDGNNTRDDAKITRLRDSALRVKDSRTRVKKRTLFFVSADVYEIARRRKIDRVGRQKGATRVKRGGLAAYAS